MRWLRFWKAVLEKKKQMGKKWCKQFIVQVPSGSNAMETKLMCFYICIYNRHWRRRTKSHFSWFFQKCLQTFKSHFDQSWWMMKHQWINDLPPVICCKNRWWRNVRRFETTFSNNHFHHERSTTLSPFIYYTQSKKTRRMKVKQPSKKFPFNLAHQVSL